MTNVILDGVGGQRGHQLLSVQSTDHLAPEAYTPSNGSSSDSHLVFFAYSSQNKAEKTEHRVTLRVMIQEQFSVPPSGILTL